MPKRSATATIVEASNYRALLATLPTARSESNLLRELNSASLRMIALIIPVLKNSLSGRRRHEPLNVKNSEDYAHVQAYCCDAAVNPDKEPAELELRHKRMIFPVFLVGFFLEAEDVNCVLRWQFVL